MPIRQIPNTDQPYYLINFDADGRERAADDGRLLSQVIVDELKTQPVTDVFLMSHGWLGDIKDAEAQYDRWLANLWSCSADLAAIKAKRPGFRPLLVGIHWPSKPFGDEETGGAFSSPVTDESDDVMSSAVSEQLALLDAPDMLRPHLETIYRAYLETEDPAALPAAVQQAYRELDRALGLSAEDDAGERGGFDPEQIFQDARAADAEADDLAGSFGGGFSWGDMLAPLRVLSFWRMKQRARDVGESGANELLRNMKQAAAGRDVRFHAMGHSFGCAVVSAMIAGAPGKNNGSAIDSLLLVQGALSLWAYCPTIPQAQTKAGYLHPLIKNRLVKGPILTTISEHDSAVGFFYPLAAGLKRQVDFGVELPKYGAIGAFGIQGLDDSAEGLVLKAKDAPYHFQPGHIYNLESSDVIRKKALVVGAHSDIAHPEIAHAWWQAAQ